MVGSRLVGGGGGYDCQMDPVKQNMTLTPRDTGMQSLPTPPCFSFTCVVFPFHSPNQKITTCADTYCDKVTAESQSTALHFTAGYILYNCVCDE